MSLRQACAVFNISTSVFYYRAKRKDDTEVIEQLSKLASLPAQRVIRELEKLLEWRGKPDKIRSDNGPEFVAEAMRGWCEQNGIQWEFIQPGKPTQNSLIERFNRTFRQDVLDSYMFDSLPQIRKYADAWAWMYNNERPHSSLGQLTPTEFLLKYGKLSEFPTFQQDSNSKSDWNFLVLNVAS